MPHIGHSIKIEDTTHWDAKVEGGMGFHTFEGTQGYEIDAKILDKPIKYKSIVTGTFGGYSISSYPHLSDRCNKISIDVSHLPTGRGKIKVLLNVVNRFRGGLALGSGNLVCICTKSYWQKSSSSAQNNITIHEIGHKVGMVSDGTGIKPDKVSSYYWAKGHIVAHCSTGLSTSELMTTDYRLHVSSSTCVMFGTGNGFSNFCVNCAPAVKKADITGGF